MACHLGAFEGSNEKFILHFFENSSNKAVALVRHGSYCIHSG